MMYSLSSFWVTIIINIFTIFIYQFLLSLILLCFQQYYVLINFTNSRVMVVIVMMRMMTKIISIINFTIIMNLPPLFKILSRSLNKKRSYLVQKTNGSFAIKIIPGIRRHAERRQKASLALSFGFQRAYEFLRTPKEERPERNVIDRRAKNTARQKDLRISLSEM